jgi:hypothetical protein
MAAGNVSLGYSLASAGMGKIAISTNQNATAKNLPLIANSSNRFSYCAARGRHFEV